MEIAAIGERKFLLAVEDESLNCSIVVVDVRVGDERVDAVHLQRDLPVDRNLTPDYRGTELPVVCRDGRVRHGHSEPSLPLSSGKSLGDLLTDVLGRLLLAYLQKGVLDELGHLVLG